MTQTRQQRLDAHGIVRDREEREACYADEITLLGSILAPATLETARRDMAAAGFDPATMFRNPDIAEAWEAWNDATDEEITGDPGLFTILATATPRVERIARCLAWDFAHRAAFADCDLSAFPAPVADEDDPYCLFRGRWLRGGQCALLCSTSGVGKSSWTMQGAAMWAGGRPFLEIAPMFPLRIGVFQTEDDASDVADFRNRIRKGLKQIDGWTDDQIAAAEGNVKFVYCEGLTNEAFCNFLEEKIKKYRFDLVIINPLFSVFQGDINDNSDLSLFLRQTLDPVLKRTKCAALLVHHAPKPPRDGKPLIGMEFAAYLGAGGSELTNYVRSALTIIPNSTEGMVDSFTITASKHGDRLGWRTADGRRTIFKTICYASVFEEYEREGIIYWLETTPEEVREARQTETPTMDPHRVEVAKRLAEIIKDQWGESRKPASEQGHGQRYWAKNLSKKETGGDRSDNVSAYEILMTSPAEYGLVYFTNPRTRKGYLIAEMGDLEADPIF